MPAVFSGKLWEVVDVLEDARKHTPSDKYVQVNPAERIYPMMSRQDLSRILDRLTSEKLIKVIRMPQVHVTAPAQPSVLKFVDDMFLLTVDVKPELADFRNDLYQSSWLPITKLRKVTLLRVFEVADEIKRVVELRTKTTFSIKLKPAKLRFHETFPGYSKENEQEYLQGRINACEFLCKVQGIKKFRWVIEGKPTNQQLLEITIDQEAFDNIYDKLVEYLPKEYFDVEPEPMPDAIMEVSPDLLDKNGKIKRESLGKPRDKPDAAQKPAAPDYVTAMNELRYDGKVCRIKDETMEHYICKLTFQRRDSKVLETTVIDKAGTSDELQAMSTTSWSMTTKTSSTTLKQTWHVTLRLIKTFCYQLLTFSTWPTEPNRCLPVRNLSDRGALSTS